MPESDNGFVSDILEGLRKDNIFDRCTVIFAPADDHDIFDEKFYRVISTKNCFCSIYDELCDWDTIPSVPSFIWEGLKKYKSTILNLTRRPYYAHILNYEEMERIYIRNIMFWNYILDIENVEMCFMACTPHTVWEYSIYALAKIKEIPTIIAQTTNIEGLYDVGTDIDTVGLGVYEYYKRLKNDNMTENERDYYEAYTATKTSVSAEEFKDRESNKANRILYWKHIPKKTIIKRQLKYWVKKCRNIPFSIHEYEYLQRHSVDRYLKFRKLKSVDYYEKNLVTNVSKDDKFILYLIQFVPEANTLPQAGELANQLLAIRILADGAKRAGVKLYVKEHWEQLAREKDFYDDLKRIPNVYCVSVKERTPEYVENSLAVCSQTGSVLLEGLLNCKPRITTIKSALAYAPGAYYVETAKDVESAINDIESGRTIRKEECTKYFISLYRNTFRLRLDKTELTRADIKTIKSEYATIIKDFIENGMGYDYYFLRKDNF